jgi:transposase-like protein
VAQARSDSADPTLSQARALIQARLEELERERGRLREALAHLGTNPTRRPAKRSSAKRAGRGQRQAEFLELLRSKPGASMSELAREMGVQPQQLYAIARRLSASGAIAKRDGSYVVVEGRPAANAKPEAAG